MDDANAYNGFIFYYKLLKGYPRLLLVFGINLMGSLGMCFMQPTISTFLGSRFNLS